MTNKSGFGRRAFLKGSVAVTVGSSLWFDALLASVDDANTRAVFTHGVASGEPQHGSVLLWTRVNPIDVSSDIDVAWEIAQDASFDVILQRGVANTSSDRDYTVKVLVEKLSPGTTYFYRFKCRHQLSEIGRTKTLPLGSLASVTLAIASCSNHAMGYFNAYESIARDDSIDYVVHLGDYIYEYGQDGWGGEVSKALGREHLPAHETVSLSDYRIRHAQYKRDRASRIMHASHPLIPIWDDHESTNNPYKDGAQNHQPETEGEWPVRKSASLKAYFEWMPVHDPKKGEDPSAMWRAFSFGDLATMVTLETRHTGRSKQVDYKAHLDKLTTDQALQDFNDKVLNDVNRTMLSPEMNRFYTDTFKQTVKKNTPWRLVANQIPMARTHVPKVDDVIVINRKDENDPLLQERKGLAALSRLNLPLYTDTWDGYPVAREQFYAMNKAMGIQDLLVLTGDSHSFWTNQLFDQSGQAMGIELGTSGISSPGDFLSFGQDIATEMDARLAKHNDEIVWTNGRENGYIKLAIATDKAVADYMTVSTVRSQDYVTNRLKQVVIKRKNGQLMLDPTV